MIVDNRTTPKRVGVVADFRGGLDKSVIVQ